MSKNKTYPKEQVQTTVPQPTKSKYSDVQESRIETPIIHSDLLFGKKNFFYMGIGVLLIFIGLALMSGGHMPNPDVWDENIIYSTRRTLIAPFIILAGLGLQFFAIFSRKD